MSKSAVWLNAFLEILRSIYSHSYISLCTQTDWNYMQAASKLKKWIKSCRPGSNYRKASLSPSGECLVRRLRGVLDCLFVTLRKHTDLTERRRRTDRQILIFTDGISNQQLAFRLLNSTSGSHIFACQCCSWSRMVCVLTSWFWLETVDIVS
jgi:hypothetical protein